jgi:hypothetical protein
MKKIVLIGLLFFYFVPMARTQEKWESPQLNVGDRWKYHSKAGGESTEEVTATEGDIYVIRHAKQFRGYDKTTMNYKYTMENNKREPFGGFLSRALDFPLSIGKKWTKIISMTPKKGGTRQVVRDYLEEYSVSGLEDVNVPAGAFTAVRIEYKRTAMRTTKQIARATFWYAPEAKALIKRVGEGLDTPDMELVAYKLK